MVAGVCALAAKPPPTPARLGDINVAGVAVDGLTPGEARQRVRRQLDQKLNTKVKLTDGSRTVAVPRRLLGVGIDAEGMIALAKMGAKTVPLRFKVDPRYTQRGLRQVAPRFAFPGRNARVFEYKGTVHIAPSLDVRRVNVPVSAQHIARTLEKDPTTRLVRLTLIKKKPPVATESLNGINARLGRFETRFNPGHMKRTKNMRLAIGRIDGTILPPGKTFSLNDTVGPRTQSSGFRTAVIFKDRGMAYDIGGGVSQVTGTLFNAALLAGLPIVTYRTHTQPVAYLPVGRDATVTWGAFDMKFKNSTDAPIIISYKLTGNRAIATLYGKKTPGRQVSVRVVSKKIGPREIRAQLWRVYKENGKVVRKEYVGSSHYQWKPGKLPQTR
jgi:vancomycin resistance protein YoaR